MQILNHLNQSILMYEESVEFASAVDLCSKMDNSYLPTLRPGIYYFTLVK